MDEVKLEFEEGALRAIARRALEKDTGARALRAIIEEFMLDIMYEIPKDDTIERGGYYQRICGAYRRTQDYHAGAGAPGTGYAVIRQEVREDMANANDFFGAVGNTISRAANKLGKKIRTSL